MPHPQNTPRGLHAKWKYKVPVSYGLQFDDYSTSTNLITANSTGLKLAGGIRLSSQSNAVLTGNSTGVLANAAIRVGGSRYINGNSTGFLFTAQAAKPSTRQAGYNWSVITNSTGVSGIMIRTTGTTWKYCSVTTVLAS